VVFSPDGMYALSGSGDSTIRLWDISTGEEARTFRGHKESVTSIAFSPDGKYVVSGSLDGTLRLWDISTSEEIAQFITLPDNEWVVIIRKVTTILQQVEINISMYELATMYTAL